ncbi:hypothetical protein BC828DRAFT_374266 [Blastocladiella britannica]|nr:hypothetical protein BC828DRAFT_374266 [Blastocladiella britannica]
MPKDSTKTAAPKRRTPYNNFMAEELKRIKAVEPGIEHKVAFKKAASNWKASPDNPKGTNYKAPAPKPAAVAAAAKPAQAAA